MIVCVPVALCCKLICSDLSTLVFVMQSTLTSRSERNQDSFGLKNLKQLIKHVLLQSLLS